MHSLPPRNAVSVKLLLRLAKQKSQEPGVAPPRNQTSGSDDEKARLSAGFLLLEGASAVSRPAHQKRSSTIALLFAQSALARDRSSA
jgi:hypothetical protein